MRSRAVSDVARQFGVEPRVISDLFYKRVLDDGICPVVCGRRIIPEDYVAVIERVLLDRRLLKDPNGGDREFPHPGQA
jgi:hypothetical protein